MKQVGHAIAAGALNILYSSVRLVKQFGFFVLVCLGFFCIVLRTSWKNLCNGHFLLSQNAAKLFECECSGPLEMVVSWSVLEKRLQFVWGSQK